MFENTSTVIWKEDAHLTIEKSTSNPYWIATISDDDGEIVDAHSTDMELLMMALEDNCTEWLEENAAE